VARFLILQYGGGIDDGAVKSIQLAEPCVLGFFLPETEPGNKKNNRMEGDYAAQKDSNSFACSGHICTRGCAARAAPRGAGLHNTYTVTLPEG